MWDILNSFSFTFLTASFSDLVDFDIQNTESFPLDAFSIIESFTYLLLMIIKQGVMEREAWRAAVHGVRESD